MICEKCLSDEIRTVYHKQGCSDEACRCATCAYGSHAKRHDEHLHRFCQGCHFDWTDDVAAGGGTA